MHIIYLIIILMEDRYRSITYTHVYLAHDDEYFRFESTNEGRYLRRYEGII